MILAPDRLRRIRLGSLMILVALLALALAVAMPLLRRALGPNTWIVRTEHRPDGTTVRVRVRRYPDRDVVFEEILPATKGRAIPSVPN